MPTEYWRAPETIDHLNRLERPGFAAEFLKAQGLTHVDALIDAFSPSMEKDNAEDIALAL